MTQFVLHIDGADWVFAPDLVPDTVPGRDMVRLVKLLEDVAMGDADWAAFIASDHGDLHRYFRRAVCE